MDYQEFVNRVMEKTGLETEEVRKLIEACLETFGERIDATERKKLADQLSGNLGEMVLKRHEATRNYSLEEFYTRVAHRAGIRYRPAVDQTISVFETLRDAVSWGQIEKALKHLPENYRELFGTPPEGPLSPTV